MSPCVSPVDCGGANIITVKEEENYDNIQYNRNMFAGN